MIAIILGLIFVIAGLLIGGFLICTGLVILSAKGVRIFIQILQNPVVAFMCGLFTPILFKKFQTKTE